MNDLILIANVNFTVKQWRMGYSMAEKMTSLPAST